jgi:DNA polymerase V
MDKTIAVIDLKSFYASCECACRHLDIFTTPLVCCDPYRSPASVLMSVTPNLKERYGVPNVCRRGDLPKVPGMIFAVPRMSYYLEMSSRVVSIFLDYVAADDLHVYSVDESFLNLGPYLNLYRATPEELVRRIQRSIKEELGLVATAGLGPNMFLAKMALDREGKKKPPFLARWDHEDVPAKLWTIRPIEKVWGIKEGTASHLARIGIRSLKELALADEGLLAKEFGVLGQQLKDLANGRDESDIADKYVPQERSLSSGQTLKRDYQPAEALLLLREMADDLTFRLRDTGLYAQKIMVWAGYGKEKGSYGKEMGLPIATDDGPTLFQADREAFCSGIENLPIRRLGLVFGGLARPDNEQISLFLDDGVRQERDRLAETLGRIKARYGKNSVLRASSLLEGSTAKTRHEEIGGHRR